MKTRLLIGAALVAALAAGLGTYAWAASSEGQTINACAGPDGKLRLVAVAGSCKAGEDAVSWNTTGPQGPAGRDGRDATGGGTSDPNAVDGTASITAQKQGDLGTINVIGVSHEIISPRDAASGLPTGKRQHKPFVITKELDKSTPLLLNALVQNENLPQVTFTYLRDGKPVATVKLTNASLATYDAHGESETWSFTYQKITWTWLDGGITAEDDWQSPTS